MYKNIEVLVKLDKIKSFCSSRGFKLSSNYLNKDDKISKIENKPIKKLDEQQKPPVKEEPKNVLLKLFDKLRNKKEEKYEERKGPFKNYFEDEERDKKSIMYYEDFIDRNTKDKNRENFMVSFFSLKYFFEKLHSTFLF